MKVKKSRIIAGLLAASLVVTYTGCDNKTETQKEIKNFTAYIGVGGRIPNAENDIQEIIAEKIGARCYETQVSPNKSADKEVSEMIIDGKYPDFIFAGSAHQKLIEAEAFIPLDEYWDDYTYLKNFYSDEIWDKIRSEDGHIYYIPPYDNIYMYDTETIHNMEAFWIQVKVLQWAGYPEIVTLDDYFDLLERYKAANPVADDGSENIAYEILTDGYMYFCLENPPQFLDGYPNDGCCIVDPETNTAIDYNTTDTAKRWFKKLNEEYHKGIIDPECFVLTINQYFEKISSGNVLGMVDQHWNFKIYEDELPDECQYVPVGVVIDENINGHYYSLGSIDVSQGMGISVSCNDIEGALTFMNGLLDPEVNRLRFWGVEGQDYTVDSEGLFVRNEEQIKKAADDEYNKAHYCTYANFPYRGGMDLDGKNAYSPENQPSIFFDSLSSIMKECFTAYGVKTYPQLLNEAGENPEWFPMWSYTNTFTSATDYGRAKENMDRVKRQYLPKVVMSNDFEKAWNEYIEIYNRECDVDVYLDELNKEIARRIGEN